MVRVTFDSNVFISALNFSGTPARLLKLAEEAAFALQISQPILDEVLEVLERKFGWPRERIDYARRALSDISQAVLPHVALDVVKRDVSDNRILECAQASRSDYIVTSDKDLLDLKVHEGADIINPDDFLVLLRQRGR